MGLVNDVDREQDAPVSSHRRRSCSDVTALSVFGFFVAFLAVTGAIAISFGSPSRLLYGHDSFGNVCGVDNAELSVGPLTGLDMQDKPYLFFFDLDDPRESLRICVKQCPDRRLANLLEVAEFAVQSGSTLCRYGISPSEYAVSDAINISASDCDNVRRENGAFEIIGTNPDESCLVRVRRRQSSFGACPVLPVPKTVPILNRCAPNKSDADLGMVYDFYAYLNSFDLFAQIMADLYAGFREVIGICLGSYVLGLLILILFICTPRTFVILVLILVIVGAAAECGVLWWTWADIKSSLDSRLNFGQYDVLVEETRNEIVLLVFAFSSIPFVLTLFFMAAVFRGSWKRHLVAKIYSEASACIRSCWGLLFLPVLTIIALGSFFLGWIYLMLCISTSDYPRFLKKDLWVVVNGERVAIPESSFSVIEYDEQNPLRLLWIPYVFALIWISEFILGFQQLITAGCVSMWYFERRQADYRRPVWRAFKCGLLYHTGSVALGSLLTLMFKGPRTVWSQIRRSLRGKTSRPVECMNLVCRPCWWFYERFLRHINHNAYAIIATRGSNFMAAAYEATSLMTDADERLVQVNRDGDLLAFLGKCAVTSVMCSIGLIAMRLDVQLHFFAIPFLLTCIFAYFIVHSVISLHEMVIDTLCLCYCEDLRMNDAPFGDEDNTTFAPETFKLFMAEVKSQNIIHRENTGIQ